MTFNSKVYREQGGSTMVFASGAVAKFEAGAQISGLGLSGVLPGNLASGTIPLGAHLFSARKLSSAENYATGAIHLTTTGNPSLEHTSTADQSAYISWASGQTVGLKLPPVAMPADLATAGGMRIDLYGRTAGTATANDASAQFDVRCWSGVGDTEMGTTHANFTSTPAWQSISIASGDLTTNMLNITLVPQTHAGRELRLYDMRARYVRTS